MKWHRNEGNILASLDLLMQPGCILVLFPIQWTLLHYPDPFGQNLGNANRNPDKRISEIVVCEWRSIDSRQFYLMHSYIPMNNIILMTWIIEGPDNRGSG